MYIVGKKRNPLCVYFLQKKPIPNPIKPKYWRLIFFFSLLIELVNYENTAFYSIQVSVDDGIYKTKINITITVDNENEWTPSFVKSGKVNLVTIDFT